MIYNICDSCIIISTCLFLSYNKTLDFNWTRKVEIHVLTRLVKCKQLDIEWRTETFIFLTFYTFSVLYFLQLIHRKCTVPLCPSQLNSGHHTLKWCWRLGMFLVCFFSCKSIFFIFFYKIPLFFLRKYCTSMHDLSFLISRSL